MNSQWKTVDLPSEMRVDGTLYALPQ
jgi:hypothetical protein